MEQPLLIDFFCGPGGAARGYADAGFRVIGIDIDPQPSYPYEFIQADALEAMDQLIGTGEFAGIKLSEVAAFHGSPPCQRFSSLTSCRLREKGLTPESEHPDLIDPTRQRFMRSGLPYIIENVQGSTVNPTVILCGSMFGKRIWWHRLFETNFPVTAPAPCDHSFTPMNPFARKNHAAMMKEFPGQAPETVMAKEKGIDPAWMAYKERRQAVPLYYTEYIGRTLLQL